MPRGATFTQLDDMRRGDWTLKGACRDHPHPEWWMHTTGAPLKSPDSYYDEARDVCAGCPVKAECGNYAVTTDQQFGMWGGLTPKQRRHIRYRKDFADAGARRVHVRRTCMGCAKSRRLKFFPDPELSVCESCLSEPVKPSPVSAATRQVPPESEIRDLLLGDEYTAAELASMWGVTEWAVTKQRSRVRKSFGLPALPGGRRRVVPSDAAMASMFRLGWPVSKLASLWEVSERTVYRHKRRLGFADAS